MQQVTLLTMQDAYEKLQADSTDDTKDAQVSSDKTLLEVFFIKLGSCCNFHKKWQGF